MKLNLNLNINKGYEVIWSTKLSPIQMPEGTFHYIIFLIKGKL
jgi:hypothetical protein